MKYKLKDLQIAGRYFGGDVVFDSKEEIYETLADIVEDNLEEFPIDLPLWELLEMSGYEIEEIRGREYESLRR